MTRKLRLLDTFCKAGGAGMGYHLAGFEVVGVDIEPQKRYPFEFHQGDALGFIEKYGKEFDVIHASPPCLGYSVMTLGRWKDREHQKLIPIVREYLLPTGKPYVIENVSGSRKYLINPIMLCGTMFGLQTKNGNQLLRHRYFECSTFFALTPTCQHMNGSAIGVYGGGQNPSRKKAIGVWDNSGGSSKRDGALFGIQERKEAMGIDWMTGKELSQAIPPAYTKWIGEQLMRILE